jgi:hypothetical protein
MKKLIIIIAIMVQGIMAFSQSSSDRRNYAAGLNALVPSVTIQASGPSNNQIVFSGYSVNTMNQAAAFLLSAGWPTFEKMYDEGFTYVCFKEIDKCYTKTALKHMLR